MDIKTIVRTSAIVYADGMEERKTDTIRRKFIESVLVQNGNTPITVQEIAIALEEDQSLQFVEGDIESLIDTTPSFVQILGSNGSETKYTLEENRYRFLVEKAESNAESTIDRYIQLYRENLSASGKDMKELLNRYLYALLNSNIEAFNLVLDPNAKRNNGRVVSGDFSESEISLINEFISWHDDSKNKELYKLVSYCIEYAIVVNNSTESTLVKSLKSKEFYLDNSLIYRAIGINGEVRRKRTLSFIKKCVDSGQHLFVSKYSRDEFLDTIDFHIGQLSKSTPFGRINPRIFQRYANGIGFYQYYHEWREGKVAYGFELFKAHVISEYKNLLKAYNIQEDFKIPFREEDNKDIEEYQEQIKQEKGHGHDSLHFNDACNMCWIEAKRNGNEANLIDTKYYFVTSDQKLQHWDYRHSKNQPITLLPSQWMALLLKYVSRTSDDYNSFVSFLKLPHNEPSISPDELQSVMAGISEITESFKTQTDIVNTLFEADWRSLLKDSPRTSAKEFAKEKLEDQLVERMMEEEQKHRSEIEQQQLSHASDIEELSRNFNEKMAEFKKQAESLLVAQELNYKEQKISDLERQIRDLASMKERADEAVNRQMIVLKTICGVLMMAAIAAMIYFVFLIGWDVMEKYIWVIGVLFGATGYLYYLSKGSRFSIDNYFKQKKESYTIHYYSLFMYSQESYDRLMAYREELASSIQENLSEDMNEEKIGVSIQ